MKQDKKRGKKNQIGAIGENIAVKYVKQKGFSILTTNYLKKWGEIDIVAQETITTKETLHFIEVKTVSYETKDQLVSAVASATWRPEENVTRKKIQKITRTIESWIAESNYSEVDWQIDVIAIRIVSSEKYATVKYIPNVM